MMTPRALTLAALVAVAAAVAHLPRPSLRPVVGTFDTPEAAFLKDLGRHAVFVVRSSETILGPPGAAAGSSVRPLASRLRDQYLFGPASLISQIESIARQARVTLDPTPNARQRGVLSTMASGPVAGVQAAYLSGLLADYDLIIAAADAVIGNEALDKNVRGFADFLRPPLARNRAAVRFVQRFPSGLPGGVDRPPVVGPSEAEPGAV